MYLRYIHFCFSKSVRSLHYTQLRFVTVEMTFMEIASISSLTLKVNKHQTIFITLYNDMFHVIATCKKIPLTHHIGRKSHFHNKKDDFYRLLNYTTYQRFIFFSNFVVYASFSSSASIP